MFKLFVLALYLVLTNAFVSSLPSEQLVYKTDGQDSNNQITVNPINQNTFQLDWLNTIDSESPFAPQIDLKFESFDLTVVLSHASIWIKERCSKFFIMVLRTNDQRPKRFSLDCIVRWGKFGSNFVYGGKSMSTRSVIENAINFDDHQKRNFTASCKLKVTLEQIIK